MVMPRLMVSVTVVGRVPSRWYSLFDGDFFSGDIQGFALWCAEAHCPGVTPVGELSQVLLKSEGFEANLYNLESSTKLLF